MDAAQSIRQEIIYSGMILQVLISIVFQLVSNSLGVALGYLGDTRIIGGSSLLTRHPTPRTWKSEGKD